MLLLPGDTGQELDRTVQPAGQVVRDPLVERPRLSAEDARRSIASFYGVGSVPAVGPLTRSARAGNDRRDGGAVDDCVRLAPRETAAGREVHGSRSDDEGPGGGRADAGQHRRQVGPAALVAGPRPLVLAGTRRMDGRTGDRLQRAPAGDGRDLAWVGFFAVKRRDVDSAPLAVRDEELIQEFPAIRAS